jgi:hypothetical protein
MAKTKRTPKPTGKQSTAVDPAEAAGQIARFLEDAAAAFALASRDVKPPYYLPAGWPLAEKYRIQTERDLDDVPAEHQPVVREQYAAAVERFEAHAQELHDNRRRLAQDARALAGLLAHVDLDGRPLRHFAAALNGWWTWPSALEAYNAARSDLEEAQSRFEAEARGAKGKTLKRRRRPPEVILKNMSPRDFEVLVADVYEKQGYAVRLGPGSHDEGVDIEATKAAATSTERIVIQCKHQQENVGRPVVQHLWGVISADPGITRGVLATSSGFTSGAMSFAGGKRLTLIDGRQVRKLAEEHGVATFVSGP